MRVLDKAPTPVTDIPAVATAPAAPELSSKDTAAKQQDISELRFQRTLTFATLVKSALRDPDSLVWEDIYANENATVICINYRAKNGFGGMNREFVVYAAGKSSQTAKAWNQHCMKNLFDMSFVGKAVS